MFVHITQATEQHSLFCRNALTVILFSRATAQEFCWNQFLVALGSACLAGSDGRHNVMQYLHAPPFTFCNNGKLVRIGERNSSTVSSSTFP